MTPTKDPGKGLDKEKAKAAREQAPGWVRPKAGKVNPATGKKWTAATAKKDDAADLAERKAAWEATL